MVGYEIDGEIDPHTVRGVIESVAPLCGDEMTAELAKLAAKTKRRDNGDGDTSLLIAAYVEELAEYPADVVRYVLKQSARNNKFFPAWAELYEDLEFWGRRRLLLRDAVIKHGME